MIHKGVEYTVTAGPPGTWKWQFRIGDRVVSGKTEAKLQLLAMRRVQLRIDRELKKISAKYPAVFGNFSAPLITQFQNDYSMLSASLDFISKAR
jgi:hypothetical protein